ncbi:hypothetical protein ATJ93_3465 [Halopiger aswanensis]|uniref:Uncharacterized protein n=2 Tax=Halopiger aswanensis TaxID=148449 RepID=A0A3R7EDW7_9EURY|nr:hypothetical protein ATJ93_3465 [Halopiger aswanensis]
MRPSGQNEIDLIDVAALIFLPFFASLIFGVFTISIDVFGGYNLTGAIWTIGARISRWHCSLRSSRSRGT